MIKTLVTNIKRNADMRYRFTHPHVLVLGDNGSGKSSLVHGIELACFGQVFDAAGKDIKLKRHLEFMVGHNEEVNASILLADCESYRYGNDKPDVLNAMQMATSALTGGTNGLCRFLLKYMDEDMPLCVTYQGWSEQVKQHGSYRAALLRMEEVVGKSLRKHRATLKELDVALKYSPHDEDLLARRAQAVLHEATSKDLSAQIQKEMLRFVEEVSKGLEDRMLRYTPDGMGTPKLFMRGNDVRIGFVERPVPSGAEGVALALALAAAVLPMEKSIIVFPDRAYDKRTLGKMMRVAHSIPAFGVYVQSTVLPEHYEAEELGWQIVKV